MTCRADFAYFHRSNPCIAQRRCEITSVTGCDRNQQSTSGLRIEENCPYLFGNTSLVVDDTFGELAICVQPCRDVSRANAIERISSGP